MKEKEYLLATNLAKMRMAEHILRDCLFMKTGQQNNQLSIIKALAALRQQLEEEIR